MSLKRVTLPGLLKNGVWAWHELWIIFQFLIILLLLADWVAVFMFVHWWWVLIHKSQTRLPWVWTLGESLSLSLPNRKETGRNSRQHPTTEHHRQLGRWLFLETKFCMSQNIKTFEFRYLSVEKHRQQCKKNKLLFSNFISYYCWVED